MRGGTFTRGAGGLRETILVCYCQADVSPSGAQLGRVYSPAGFAIGFLLGRFSTLY